MKKIILLSTLFAFIAVNVFAQHTAPRYGTTPSSNRTYSGLHLELKYLADEAGVDTITISPNAYQTDYVLTLTDTVVIAFSSIADSWRGDNINISVQNTAGSNHVVYFLGYSGLATKWGMTASGGTSAVLASSKSGTFVFRFDSALWNEVSRAIR